MRSATLFPSRVDQIETAASFERHCVLKAAFIGAIPFAAFASVVASLIGMA